MADRNSDPIKVVGIIDLNKALKATADGAPKEMQQGLKEIAAVIARATASKVPARTGRAASSYKPRATQTGAGIAFGGKAAPWTPWLEFGGSVGPGHVAGVPFSGAIRRPWEGRPVGDGRYLYPTISEHHDETNEKVLDLMAKLAERHGLDVQNG